MNKDRYNKMIHLTAIPLSIAADEHNRCVTKNKEH